MNEHGRPVLHGYVIAPWADDRPVLRGYVTAPSADSQLSGDRCWASLGRSGRDHAADVVTRSRATLSIHVNHTSTPHNV